MADLPSTLALEWYNSTIFWIPRVDKILLPCLSVWYHSFWLALMNWIWPLESVLFLLMIKILIGIIEYDKRLLGNAITVSIKSWSTKNFLNEATLPPWNKGPSETTITAFPVWLSEEFALLMKTDLIALDMETLLIPKANLLSSAMQSLHLIKLEKL